VNVYRKWLLQVGALLLVMTAVLSAVSKALYIDPVFLPPRLGLAPGTETLVVGASHAACAFDPDRFRRAQSIARHGELVFFTAAKLRAVLDENPEVRTVLMAFAPIHLAAWQDQHLFGADAISRTHFMDYYMLLGPEARETVSGWHSDDVLARLKYDYGLPLGYAEDTALIADYLRGTLTPESYDFWGGYTPVTGSHLGERRNRAIIQKYFYLPDGERAGTSELALRSVREMLQLATDRDLRMILVNTPQQALFREATPAFFEEHYAQALAGLRRDFPQVEVIHDSRAVDDDALFLDADHLNAQGGALYSELLAVRLGLEPDA
jgi:hypothetical protein